MTARYSKNFNIPLRIFINQLRSPAYSTGKTVQNRPIPKPSLNASQKEENRTVIRGTPDTFRYIRHFVINESMRILNLFKILILSF